MGPLPVGERKRPDWDAFCHNAVELQWGRSPLESGSLAVRAVAEHDHEVASMGPLPVGERKAALASADAAKLLQWGRSPLESGSVYGRRRVVGALAHPLQWGRSPLESGSAKNELLRGIGRHRASMGPLLDSSGETSESPSRTASP